MFWHYASPLLLNLIACSSGDNKAVSVRVNPVGKTFCVFAAALPGVIANGLTNGVVIAASGAKPKSSKIYSLKFRLNRFPITIRGTDNLYGFAYCGPRMHTINKYALNMMSGSGGRAQTTTIGGASDSTVTTAISPMQMHNWANFRLTGTYNTSFDGELVQFQDITNRDLKTNLALPTEITES